MLSPFLVSLLVALGVLFLGKFIGKQFSLSPYSYLGFSIISFIFAFICHAKGQDALVKLFANFPLIDRSTIVWSAIGLCVIFILSILIVEMRKNPSVVSVDRTFNNPDLFPDLNETLLKVWATEKAKGHYGVKLIQLYISPKAGQRYYIYFGMKKFYTHFIIKRFYKTEFYRDLFTNFLRKKDFLYSLKKTYRSDLPLHWQDEWMLDTKLADGIDKNVYWTLYKK